MRISESKLRGVIRGVLFEMYGGPDDYYREDEASRQAAIYGLNELEEDELMALRDGFDYMYFGENDTVARNVDNGSLCVIDRDEIVGTDCVCVDVMNPELRFDANFASLSELGPVSRYL